MNNNTNNTSDHGREPLFASTLGAILFLALLGVLSFFGYKLNEIEDSIEDRLVYQPPVTVAAEKSDNGPVYTTSHAHTIYVPVYSHIYALGGTPVLLETTLSVRNTDPKRRVVITSINYYDTKGNMVEAYLDGNLVLGPLESSEVLIKKRDIRGGSGANFMVTWSSDEPVHLPSVQAVMVGGEGDSTIAFRTNGRPLTSRIDSKNQQE